MMDGDLFMDRAGQSVTVEGIEKCAQDMAEALLNNYDPEDPPPYNGSELYTIDGMVPEAPSDLGISSMIERMATDAIERLMDFQQNDPYVDDDELIDEIRDMRVWKIGELSWAFHAFCITESDEPAEVGFDISLDQQLPGTIIAEGFPVLGEGTFL